jgi:(p)ppGpp synthase/HD superfamily hydrolase
MTGADLILVSRAADFAARRHLNHRRKGAVGEPYLNHLIEVGHVLAEATEGRDAALVAAGLLHDTLEDTPTTFEELETQFGHDIAGLVAEVTDDKRLPKAERKRLQVVTAPTKSERARLIKIADKISNVRALAHSPPADWNVARIVEYIDWAEQVVAGCRGINAALERAFDGAVMEARTAVAA